MIFGSRTFLRAPAAILLPLALFACGGQSAPPGASGGAAPGAAQGSDVVLITIDTLRYDSLGFTGNAQVETPALDRLARSGLQFDKAHGHNVVTLPSHTNILTGRYPYDHGVRENSGFVLGEDVPTLATLLKAEGYATGAFVAAFPLDARFGLARGFDVYDDRYPDGSTPDAFVIAERPGDQVVAPALEWWRSQAGKKRFLWVHLYDPHAPYLPPEPFATRYADRRYLGEVAAVDAHLQPLLSELEGGDGGSPPLVVMTSDHGEALGDHGEATHGLFAYEATLKVPLVIAGPGIEPGVDSRSAGHVDILPTLLEALEVAAPEGLPGRSLLAGEVETGRGLYFESLSTYFNREWAPLRGLVRDRMKWIELPLPELYDLEADPAESNNLVDERRRLANELRLAMPTESDWPPGRGTISSEEEAKLRALGYVSSSGGSGKTTFTEEDDPKRLVALDRKIRLAIDHYSQGRLDQAAEMARQVIGERDTMAVGYDLLALSLRQSEQPAEAIRILEQAVAKGIQSRSLNRQLGLTLAENGRGEEAVLLLEALASEEDLETLVALGNAQYAAGDLGAARQTMERVLAVDATNVRAFEALGAVALAAGRPDVGRRYLEQALSLNPELPIAWNSLGVALFQLGDRGAALDAWERSVRLDPRQFDALINLGMMAAEQGQTERARAALRQFIATAPAGRYAEDLARARALLGRMGG